MKRSKRMNEREVRACRDHYKFGEAIPDNSIEKCCSESLWLSVYRFKYACKELIRTFKEAFRKEVGGKDEK